MEVEVSGGFISVKNGMGVSTPKFPQSLNLQKHCPLETILIRVIIIIIIIGGSSSSITNDVGKKHL